MSGTVPSAGQPEQIGRYRVEAVLGRGAMGVIFRAHDPVIDRKVAIKLVRTDLLEGEDRTDYITRFRQEAQAAGRCSHPNIVAVYDFALHEGNPYLAMEYIDGVSLNHVVARAGGFTVAEVVDMGRQVLDGLGAAHALGVVHRDIKPANIMLTERGRVKVTDFGISRLDTSQITGAGAVVGTPSYMSPEQCRGEAVDARSDLFAVGVVLYELLTGSKPFAGRSSHEVWNRLLNQEPPDSAGLRPDAPEALHAVLRRSLAKSPDARFSSAAAMANALAQAGSIAVGPSADLDLDRTVLAPRGKQVSSSDEGSILLDSTTMTTIERRLARYVGPIAPFLLKNAIRKSDTLEGLHDALVQNIDNAQERRSLSQELQVELAGSVVSTVGTRAGATLAEPDMLRAQTELARYVGPVARVLVKRAAVACAGTEQLWQRLAQHIDDPAQRAVFLGKL